ncbi:hypothetical protein [Thermovibrio ammonificans]
MAPKLQVFLVVDGVKLPVEELTLTGCRLSWAPELLIAQKWAVGDLLFSAVDVEISIKNLKLSFNGGKSWQVEVAFHQLTESQRRVLGEFIGEGRGELRHFRREVAEG